MEDRYKLFTQLINKITRNIRKIKTAEMAEFDLKSSHISCLYYLQKGQGMSAHNLCEVCDEDKSAISKSLEQLENAGLVTRRSKTKKKYM